MSRNIERVNFLDIFKNTSTVVDDVTRRNPNFLVSRPSENVSGTLEDRIVLVQTLAPAWVNLSIFGQTMPVFGGPVEIKTRVRVSNIASNTILNLSFGIDGAEVTGNRYGLARVESVDFSPTIEFSHIVTGVAASTHSFSLMANVTPLSGSGSGMSATLTQGIAERIMITELK